MSMERPTRLDQYRLLDRRGHEANRRSAARADDCGVPCRRGERQRSGSAKGGSGSTGGAPTLMRAMA